MKVNYEVVICCEFPRETELVTEVLRSVGLDKHAHIRRVKEYEESKDGDKTWLVLISMHI